MQCINAKENLPFSPYVLLPFASSSSPLIRPFYIRHSILLILLFELTGEELKDTFYKIRECYFHSTLLSVLSTEIFARSPNKEED